jgi:hypothetical protein
MESRGTTQSEQLRSIAIAHSELYHQAWHRQKHMGISHVSAGMLDIRVENARNLQHNPHLHLAQEKVHRLWNK